MQNWKTLPRWNSSSSSKSSSSSNNSSSSSFYFSIQWQYFLHQRTTTLYAGQDCQKDLQQVQQTGHRVSTILCQLGCAKEKNIKWNESANSKTRRLNWNWNSKYICSGEFTFVSRQLQSLTLSRFPACVNFFVARWYWRCAMQTSPTPSKICCVPSRRSPQPPSDSTFPRVLQSSGRVAPCIFSRRPNTWYTMHIIFRSTSNQSIKIQQDIDSIIKMQIICHYLSTNKPRHGCCLI